MVEVLKRISEMHGRLPSAEGQDPGLAALRVIEGRTRAQQAANVQSLLLFPSVPCVAAVLEKILLVQFIGPVALAMPPSGFILFCAARHKRIRKDATAALERILLKKRLPPCTSVTGSV